jgi:hypothetical protein
MYDVRMRSAPYLLLAGIEKMSSKDQTFLLNLMETGIVTETKYGRTREAFVIDLQDNYGIMKSSPIYSIFHSAIAFFG